jgi:hypothetical protein
MAALLAWALGGTLWPRAETYDFPAVRFDDRDWNWRVAVGGRNGEREPIRYLLLMAEPGRDPRRFDDRTWVDAAGPVVADGALYVAGRASFEPGEPWWLMRIDNAEADAPAATIELPDRLAVEQKLGRLREDAPVDQPSDVGAAVRGSLDESPADDREQR